MLCNDDEKILDLIFSGPMDGYVFDSNATTVDSCPETSKIVTNEISQQLKEKEIIAVHLAEDGKIDESILLFNEIIKSNRSYYSVYNNRAQAFRIKKEDKSALNDLNFVIKNCRDSEVLKQSYIQRAIILKASDPDQSYTDFCKSNALGQKIAEKAVVENNPYRKLCNSMVSKVLQQEISGNKF
eukprot:NODE_1_length_95616_cov_0.657642.p58 type:complete len:184 gc:universal NODE_1_length_95616_cov_0.657642:76762-77313(+)